jgi:hypothetical protein
MIVVDDRKGSGHLAPLIAAHGVPVEVRRLDFGDVAFPGKGPNGPVFIGVEVKRPADLITSLISKRLTSRQLPGMIRCYDESVIAVVGRIRPTVTGSIQEWRGQWWEIPCSMSWAQLEAMKMSLRYQARVHFVDFEREDLLVQWLVVAAQWWGREWVSHRSHIPTHVAFAAEQDLVPMRYEPTNVSMHASHLPGVGTELARRIAARFKTVEAMVNAPREVWNTIRGLGPRKAAEAFLHWRERR